jgi:hypothetical protein
LVVAAVAVKTLVRAVAVEVRITPNVLLQLHHQVSW